PGQEPDPGQEQQPRDDQHRPRVRAAPLRDGGLRDRRLRAVDVVELGDHAVGVEAQVFRVLAYEGAREDAAGQDVYPVLLQRLQEAHADLGGVRDLAQVDAAQLAFTAEVLTEGGHVRGLSDGDFSGGAATVQAGLDRKSTRLNF